MSTKTTFKRVALVAVAALGLGVLSSVAPASGVTATTGYVTSISTTTDNAPVAGANAAETVHNVFFKTSTTATVNINPAAILTSTPAGSVLARMSTTNATTTANSWQFNTTVNGTTASDSANVSASTIAAAVNTTKTYSQQFLRVKYDLAGTYVWTLYEDVDGNGYVSGADLSTTLTVVVSGSGTTALKATVSATNSTSSTLATARGSLVKITLLMLLATLQTLMLVVESRSLCQVLQRFHM